MIVNDNLNRMVKINEFHCKINLDIKYYSNQKGLIKGVKALDNNVCIYLIEFTNYNRIWATREEFEFL